MYSPHQQDIKREYKASGTLSPPPDPTCTPIPGVNETMSSANNNNNNIDKDNNLHTQLYNQTTYSPLQDGNEGHGSMAIGTSKPSQLEAAYNTNQQQQQTWFGTMMDSSTFSPTSPNLLTRELLVSPSTSTTHTDSMYHTGEDDDAQQRHMQDMFDKRRRRRESHNMVERRRRDNINERIQDLCLLLPNHLINTSANPVNFTTGAQRSPNSINKGTILKLSVDHIKELRDQVVHYQHRIRDLEQMVHHGKLISTPPPPPHQPQYYNLQQQLPAFIPNSTLPLQPLDTLTKDLHQHHYHHHPTQPIHPIHHPHDIRPVPPFGTLTSDTF